MSTLHVTQIEGYLRKHLTGLVDLSDQKKHKNTSDADKTFLSRALATLAISYLVDRPIIDFVDFITDDSNDAGIDLIYFHEVEKILYVVQSKWHSSGSGSISEGDALKFLSGLQRIIELDITNFNEKLTRRIPDIKKALFDANAKIVAVIAHTGSDSISTQVQHQFDRFMDKQNDSSEIVFLEVLNQSRLHKAVTTGLGGKPIDIDVQILNWGQISEPRKAVYGRVFVSDVASWFTEHGVRLFDKNIRQFLSTTEVNESIKSTLLRNPENFWYFNNGITAIANSIEKSQLAEIKIAPAFGNAKVFLL